VVLVVAACAPAGASWTFDPNIGLATGAPAASGGASAAPSAEASAAATAEASSSPAASGLLGGSPAPAGSGGAVIDLVAKDVAFDAQSLTAQANAPFQIQFDNQDTGVPHNVAIYGGSSPTNNLFRGAIVTGPGQMTYDVPALPPGTYTFQCDVHPTVMKGTIVVH
jgi:plastocyanin